MSYGSQLKRKLADSGITQQQLSNATNISKSSISQYISGHVKPSEINQEKIEAIVGKFQEEAPAELSKNISPEIASKMMGVSPQFVRIGLQHGIFEFGYAVKMSSQYRYHISPKKFKEYIGEELFNQI